MATITANTGSNNWNTNGAWVGSVQPTAADDVVIPASAVVTIPASTTALGRSCTVQASGTVAFAATTSALNLGDGTAGAGNVALSVSSSATITLTAVGSIVFKSTSATTQTVATGGKTMPNMTFQGAGSSYQCSDAINTGTATTITLTNGTLDLNGKSHNVGLFSITGSSTRTLTFNAAAITITGTGNNWNANVTTNLTFTPDTGSITCTGGGSILGAMNFVGGGLTYNNVTLSCIGISNTQGANTFANLTFSGGAAAATEFRISANQTVTGTLTLNGTTVAQRACVRSNVSGTQRTLTAATLSSNGFIDLIDIVAAGASSPWTNTGWGIYNVSSITGATPVTTYWVGGTGNSNDATKYASSSGGTANTQRAPLMQDTAYYDANSGAGTVTINHYRCGTMDFTNCALTSVSAGGSFADRIFVGDFILNPNVAMTEGGFADAWVFMTGGTQTITTAGSTLATHAYQFTGTGTYILGSNFTSTSTITMTNGTLTTNNYNVTCTALAVSGGTINAGSSTFYCTITTAGSTPWSATGGTLNMGTSNIIITNSTAINQTFAGGGKTYFKLVLTPSGGTFTITGSNSYNSLQMASAGTKTIAFTSATTQTMLSTRFFRGTSGNLITIQAVTAASAFTLSCTNTIRTDFISLKDCTASGGINFYAGANSTNASGNTNWTFAQSPRDGDFNIML